MAAAGAFGTGTGLIDIAAGGDIVLNDSSAAVYTVGENQGTGTIPDVSGLSPEVIQELFYEGDFLANGGDLRLIAQNDIRGANGHQLISEWLARNGGVLLLPDGAEFLVPASWAVNIGAFRQNVGALGGGDVQVSAGGDVTELSVMLPTTGQPQGDADSAPAIAGGGDLSLDAGGDILSGVFFVERGRGRLRAGGAITRAPGQDAHPIFALGDAQFSVRARQKIDIESVLNPSVVVTSPTQGISDLVLPTKTFFFTYGEHSAATFEALSGDIALHNRTEVLQNVSDDLAFSGSESLAFAAYPATLKVRSLQGSILVANGFSLSPSAVGDLQLLAGQNMSLDPSGASTVNLIMSDADAALLPSTVKTSANLDDANIRLTIPASPDFHAASPVHAGDASPVQVAAQRGYLGIVEGSQELRMYLPKQARAFAGGDVSNLSLNIQHVRDTDISELVAVSDIFFPTLRTPAGAVVPNTNAIEVAGPGDFFIIAGGDVDLGGSNGVRTVGNLQNPVLAAAGADVTVVAGVDPSMDYDEFIQRYLVESNDYQAELATYLTERTANGTDVATFSALPPREQREFVFQVFFSELRASGISATKQGDRDFSQGFAAIATLFPDQQNPGDVKSFLSQITTLDGGSINLLVPSGLINAGVAGAVGINKPPAALGITAQREGDINGFSDGDFLVNQSRVFALDGGDITIWSSVGDIDAGRGAKTALSIPPPTVTFDANGNAVVEFPPAISGSGIRGAVSTPNRAPGDVFLFAPGGVVNAGDAGISSAGNLTVAATAVLGADNISVGGTSTGVPTATVSVPVGLASASSAVAATVRLPAELMPASPAFTTPPGAKRNTSPGARFGVLTAPRIPLPEIAGGNSTTALPLASNVTVGGGIDSAVLAPRPASISAALQIVIPRQRLIHEEIAIGKAVDVAFRLRGRPKRRRRLVNPNSARDTGIDKPRRHASSARSVAVIWLRKDFSVSGALLVREQRRNRRKSLTEIPISLLRRRVPGARF